jgi:hypothetical protein
MRKAYLVYGGGDCGEDGLPSIVFADTPGQAKYKSNAYGEYPFTELTVRRRPQLDQYAERGSVPDKALLADGWIYEEMCATCGKYQRLSQKTLDDGDIRVEFSEAGNIKRFICWDCASRPRKEAAPDAD